MGLRGTVPTAVEAVEQVSLLSRASRMGQSMGTVGVLGSLWVVVDEDRRRRRISMVLSCGILEWLRPVCRGMRMMEVVTPRGRGGKGASDVGTPIQDGFRHPSHIAIERMEKLPNRRQGGMRQSREPLFVDPADTSVPVKNLPSCLLFSKFLVLDTSSLTYPLPFSSMSTSTPCESRTQPCSTPS
jgi:hypothetical protein